MGSDEFLLATASQPRSKLVVQREQLFPQGRGARLVTLAALWVSLLESRGDIGHHPSRELWIQPHVRVEACGRLTLGATLLLVDPLAQGQSITGVHDDPTRRELRPASFEPRFKSRPIVHNHPGCV